MHLMFRWAKVSKSGFYEWKGRGPSQTSRRRELLGRLITALFEASDGTYGYRRIHADLRRSGYWADDETVRQIMRELELVPCQPRPFRPITTIAGDTGQTPDLLKRDFTASVPGTKLVGDITISPRGRAGCTWRPSWTARRRRSSGTRWQITCGPRL